MACFNHWWTTTSSVAGSTSATRAVPRSSRSMACGDDRQGVGVGRAELGGPVPQLFDLGLEVGHGSDVSPGIRPTDAGTPDRGAATTGP